MVVNDIRFQDGSRHPTKARILETSKVRTGLAVVTYTSPGSRMPPQAATPHPQQGVNFEKNV
jgi:hypothetical protein